MANILDCPTSDLVPSCVQDITVLRVQADGVIPTSPATLSWVNIANITQLGLWLNLNLGSVPLSEVKVWVSFTDYAGDINFRYSIGGSFVDNDLSIEIANLTNNDFLVWTFATDGARIIPIRNPGWAWMYLFWDGTGTNTASWADVAVSRGFGNANPIIIPDSNVTP